MKKTERLEKISNKAIANEIKKEILSVMRSSDQTDNKTSYLNIATLDLRHINSAEAISEIKEIRNVALLMLPRANTPEQQSAWVKVSIKNIAKTLYLDIDDEIISHNGNGEIDLSGKGIEKRTVCMINGAGVIFGKPGTEKDIDINVNGVVILQSDLVKMSNVKTDINGKVMYVDFESYKTIQDKNITISHISNIESNTLIICQNKDIIKIDRSVKEEDLKDKNIKFVFFGKGYKCSKELRGYMSVNSSLVNS